MCIRDRSNAQRDFELSEKEKEIIRKHMWPLTIIPPTCREAWIVNSADTFISLMETIASRKRFGKMKEYWVHRPLRAMYDPVSYTHLALIEANKGMWPELK